MRYKKNSGFLRINKLFKIEVVRRRQNCVSFALNDPLATLYRGAVDKKTVIPIFEATPATVTPRNGDLMLMWDDLTDDAGGFHAARIYGNKLQEMCGLGGEFGWRMLGDAKYYKYAHRKRVATLKLPLSKKYENSKAVKLMYRYLWDRKFPLRERVEWAVDMFVHLDAIFQQYEKKKEVSLYGN